MIIALSVLWALIPLVSFVFAAPFSFLYAALRRRSWRIGAGVALYGLGVTLALFLPMHPDPDVFTFWDNLGITIILLIMGVGTAHAFLIRRRVFGLAAIRADRTLESALETAKARRELRERARALAEQDPSRP